MNISYCSDKYQYTMVKSFCDEGIGEKEAVFNMFFRKAPDNNNWAVVCGIGEVLDMIEGLGSEGEEFFKKFLPEESYSDLCAALPNLRFTGDVYAMEEGQIAFPQQPVITIKAPLNQAQVLETPLLCIMNHQMAVATKASRVTRATKKPVSEFGSRRAHGPWAAMHGGKAAYIAGCGSTSNILCTTEFGIPSTGTMAHSFVTAFGCSIQSEYKAFDSYLRSHRGESLILLLDTYDSLHSGLINAIKAFKANGIDDNYRPAYGIRLDSGDLAYLSKECRRILDQAGLYKCMIFVSNSLDEYLISDLELQDACIDAYGVGDAIATSKHNPCFGNVYKLVQIDQGPVLKLSDDRAKLINPGFQCTYRIYIDGESRADITCLRGDTTAQIIESGGKLRICDEFDQTKVTVFPAASYTWEMLQHQYMASGRRLFKNPEVKKMKETYQRNLLSLNPTERRIINPHYHKVDISDELYDLKMNLIYKIKNELNDGRNIN